MNESLPDLLAGLHGLSTPPPVSWWPQTTAWLVLVLALATTAAWLVWRRSGWKGEKNMFQLW